MTAVLGRAALAGAVAACVAAVWVSWLGARRRRPALVGTGTRLLAVAAALAVAAMAALAWALLTGDFTLGYVARATSRSMTWPYRLGSLWGGMEGSLLLWCAFLTGGAALAGRALRRRAPGLYGPAQAVLGAVGAGALLLPLVLADPFARLAVPALDGGGLTPILEHPAMLYHPPILYLGQTALAVPFALTVAALALGRLDATWLALTRRCMLVAWVALSAGLVAGAHWAYQELGWGGFWAWDPVENAGLMPWLAATAFLHAAVVAEHRIRRAGEIGASDGVGTAAGAGAAGAWTAGLAFASFALGLLGVYLTRSGVTGSVHAFAEARAVGVALLVGVGAVVVTGAVLFVRGRRRWAESLSPARRRASGREAALAANNALLIGCLLVVATGTLVPLVREALGGPDSLVGPRYFSTLASPFGLGALALAGVGPLLPWSGRRPAGARRLLAIAAAGAVAGAVIIVALGLASTVTLPAGVAAGTTIALSLVRAFSCLRMSPSERAIPAAGRRWSRTLGAAVAHLGLAVALLGVAGSTEGTSVSSSLAPGESVTVGRYRLSHEGVTDQAGDRRRSVRVKVAVFLGGDRVATLRPGLDTFERRGGPLAEAALHSTPREDLLLTAGLVDPVEGTVLLDIFVRPLVAWVWIGGLLLVAGGALALGGSGAVPGRAPAVSPPVNQTTARRRSPLQVR